MTIDTEYDDIEEFVEANREDLVNIIKHSSNTYARACAWTLLDAGSDAPELEQLEEEIQHLRQGGVA